MNKIVESVQDILTSDGMCNLFEQIGNLSESQLKNKLKVNASLIIELLINIANLIEEEK